MEKNKYNEARSASANPFCVGCKYFDNSEYAPACLYILFKKRRRGCKAGKGCTKRVEGPYIPYRPETILEGSFQNKRRGIYK